MKTLQDYQKLISSGYTLSNAELKHMNQLWEKALSDRQREINDLRKGLIETGINAGCGLHHTVSTAFLTDHVVEEINRRLKMVKHD